MTRESCERKITHARRGLPRAAVNKQNEKQKSIRIQKRLLRLFIKVKDNKKINKEISKKSRDDAKIVDKGNN